MAAQRIHFFAATGMEADVIRQAAGDWPVAVIGISGTQLPTSVDADVVILAGFGGGLDPTLKIGDVVMDAPDAVHTPIGCQQGKIACADRIVATPADKAAFRKDTGADVVEMEHASVCRLTDRLQLPLIHVRAISDTADHTLDSALLYIFDPQGNIKPTAVASLLLRRPGMIPELIRLFRRTKFAGKRLAKVLEQLVTTLATTEVRHTPPDQR